METFAARAALFSLLLPLSATLAHAGEFDGWATDDFEQPQTAFLLEAPLSLRPDQSKTDSIDGGIEWTVLREQNGRLEPMVGIPVTIADSELAGLETDESGTVRMSECAPRTSWKVRAELSRKRFAVGNGDGSNYRLDAQVSCGTHVTWIFQSATNGGQALGIWRIGMLAEKALAASVGLGFWKSRIAFEWPADGDYYSFGTVHITQGNQWDVVGHELGHAIYDLGDLGAFGGGSHKIDECYSDALALSEGWASYFSAWLSIPADDADAKFEFMVPRRAPIRIENIPADVCASPKNEWRVTGFFWDLIDRNDDGEASNEAFERVWRALTGSHASGMAAARSKLEQAGLDRTTIALLWSLNFPGN